MLFSGSTPALLAPTVACGAVDSAILFFNGIVNATDWAAFLADKDVGGLVVGNIVQNTPYSLSFEVDNGGAKIAVGIDIELFGDIPPGYDPNSNFITTSFN